MPTETLRSTALPGTPPAAGPSGAAVEVAGWAVHVPGLDAARLPGSPDEPACPPERASEVLGRKGLLGKDAATRLALCAVHRALGLPKGRPETPAPGAAGTAVVVASDLGNVATVCSVTEQMRAGSALDVSPLDAPNASSNVIASTIAIWHGYTGPNLTVCDGDDSSRSALDLAWLLIAAGRAERVVVVGVEPGDDAARRLHDAAGLSLLPGAACLLLGVPGAWERGNGLRLSPAVAPAPIAQGAQPVRPGGVDLAGCYGAREIVAAASAAAVAAAAGTDGPVADVPLAGGTFVLGRSPAGTP